MDIDALGPDPAAPLLAFGLAREGARVILLAPGREPGDKAVAAAVGSRVVTDVVAGAEELPSVLSRPPGGLASLARWLRPDAVGGQAPAKQEERPPVVIERQVPLTARPVLIAVASVAPGSGCSYVAAAVAGSLAAAGQQALLLDLAPLPGLTVVVAGGTAKDGRWVPGILVLSQADARRYDGEDQQRKDEPLLQRPEDSLERIRAAMRSSVAAWVIADLGPLESMDPLWAELQSMADLTVVAGPAQPTRAWSWERWVWYMARYSKAPEPGAVVVVGADADYARQVAVLLRMDVPVYAFPAVAGGWASTANPVPPGWREEDRAVREAMQALLGGLWPRETVRRSSLIAKLLRK
ncbi:MAG: hypothetical protein QJR08_00485 [Bacillota bacterium]|nr:hypothetical protein [Bacillota bacterium]